MTDYRASVPRPIVTNPGGVIDPADLIGRDDELDRLGRAISRGGAKVLGERRMGKTSMLHAAEERLTAAGSVVVRVSAETDDPAVFAAHLRDAMVKRSHLRDALSRLGAELTIEVGPVGLRLNGTGAPGGFDLFGHCADIVQRNGGQQLVFIFDEITTLARALERRQRGAAEAFFHSLRVPRQELSGVAVVVAGSVGLHHVLSDMSTVNDIGPVEVGPLQPAAAVYLARCLFLGAGLPDDTGCATAVAEHASRVPFYIHKIVDELGARRTGLPSPAELDALVDSALRSNRWDTEHSLTRVVENFADDTDIVLAMLDHYALSAEPIGPDEILAALAGAELRTRPDRTQALRLIDRLEDDHYLVRVGDADVFATSLLRRTWRTMRRLG